MPYKRSTGILAIVGLAVVICILYLRYKTCPVHMQVNAFFGTGKVNIALDRKCGRWSATVNGQRLATDYKSFQLEEYVSDFISSHSAYDHPSLPVVSGGGSPDFIEVQYDGLYYYQFSSNGKGTLNQLYLLMEENGWIKPQRMEKGGWELGE